MHIALPEAFIATGRGCPSRVAYDALGMMLIDQGLQNIECHY